MYVFSLPTAEEARTTNTQPQQDAVRAHTAPSASLELSTGKQTWTVQSNCITTNPLDSTDVVCLHMLASGLSVYRYLSHEHSSPSHPAAEIASVDGQGWSFPTADVDSAAIARIGNTIHVSRTHSGSRPNIAAAHRPLRLMCLCLREREREREFRKLGFYSCSEAVDSPGSKPEQDLPAASRFPCERSMKTAVDVM